MLTYEEARGSIDTGDIVFVAHGSSLVSRLTELATRSSFFHVGIAVWLRDAAFESRLFIVEAHQGGRRIVSLSSYANYPLTIVSSEVPFSAYSDALMERVGSVPYGYLDYISIGLRELLHIKVGDFKGEVCSEMVARHLNMGGLYLPTLLSPAKLFRRLTVEMGWAVKLATTWTD